MAIRIHHNTLRSCMFVVELDDPFANKQPKMCPTCNKEHSTVSMHFKLDSNGDTLVSQGVLRTKHWRTLELAGFEVVNMVDPESQKVGAVDTPQQEIITVNGHGDSRGNLWVPAKDKYQNQERIQKALKPIIDDFTDLADKLEWKKKRKKGIKFFDMGKEK